MKNKRKPPKVTIDISDLDPKTMSAEEIDELFYERLAQGLGLELPGNKTIN